MAPLVPPASLTVISNQLLEKKSVGLSSGSTPLHLPYSIVALSTVLFLSETECSLSEANISPLRHLPGLLSGLQGLGLCPLPYLCRLTVRCTWMSLIGSSGSLSQTQTMGSAEWEHPRTIHQCNQSDPGSHLLLRATHPPDKLYRHWLPALLTATGFITSFAFTQQPPN